MNKHIQRLTRAALIAALYSLLTIALPMVGYGPLQFRIAESMTLLPLIFPEAVIGLSVGCFLANLASPYGWYDWVFGTLATLVAALMTYGIGKLLAKRGFMFKSAFGALPPILVNSFVLPLMWLLMGVDTAYWVNVTVFLITQTGAIAVIGIPLINIVKNPLSKFAEITDSKKIDRAP